MVVVKVNVVEVMEEVVVEVVVTKATLAPLNMAAQLAKVNILLYINCGLRLCDKGSFNRQDSCASMSVMKSLQIS